MAKQDYKTLELPAKYTPKKSEPYMCLEQRAYFYQILMAQKQEIIDGNSDVLNTVRGIDSEINNGGGDDAKELKTEHTDTALYLVKKSVFKECWRVHWQP